jgi:RNA polymerase sigma-70 factor (ECF subfamily)
LHTWIGRLRAGDLSARDELLRGIGERLQALAHKMLGRFPAVRRWADTDDVLQNAQLRLLRSLQDVRPDSTRDFFGLAAEQIRRELLDLARHFHGPQGIGAYHAGKGVGEDSRTLPGDLPDLADEPGDLDRWAAFHEEVAKLPVEWREVVGLIYYHGWKQAEVAQLMGVTVRTVQRRWESALTHLHCRLKKDGPADAT